MSKRTTDRLALLSWPVALAFSGFGVVLHALNRSIPLNTSIDAKSLLSLFVSLLVQTAFSTMGVLIASRRRDNAIGWIFIATGLILGLSSCAEEYAIHALLAAPALFPGGEIAAWILPLTHASVFPLFVFLLLLFPNGRVLSHRWRVVLWLATGAATALLAVSAFTPGQLSQDTIPIINPFGIGALGGFLQLLKQAGWLLIFATLIAATASLVLRYRRATGEERHQIKWFASAGVLVAAVFLANPITLMGIPALTSLWEVLFFLAIATIPIAAGIAILKYRLYDIDLIIRRTLIYSALTASLAFVYFGSVILLQLLFRELTGQQQSEIVTVISTLSIAALFVPLRSRIQRTIDRRFYRRKYDAQKVLAEFAATARDEVDLSQLSERLLDVVDETMQPTLVSLWLRKTDVKR